MEVLEVVTGTDYSNARELPNHGGRLISKHQKSPGGSSGSGGNRNSYIPRLSGKALSELQKADQETTAANRTVMWLHRGKCRFVKASEYERLRAALDSPDKVELCHDMIAPPRGRTAGTTRR